MSSRRGHRLLQAAAAAMLGFAVVLGLMSVPAGSAVAASSSDASITATERSIRCARAGSAAGWSGSTLVTAVAIAIAESWCTAGAAHSNPPNADCPYGSTDRGAWQINDCYQSWVSDSCAYELYCNARAAHTIYGWSGWGAWTTYLNGAYRSYLSEAQAGVDAISGGVYGTVTTGSNSEALYVRAGPATSYSIVGSLANGTRIRILCQTHGEWIYSEVYGIWTNL